MAYWCPDSKDEGSKSVCGCVLRLLARLLVDKLLKSTWTYMNPDKQKCFRSSRRVLDIKLPVKQLCMYASM